MTITSYNPRTGHANATVEEMSFQEVNAAVERAAGASSGVAAASPWHPVHPLLSDRLAGLALQPVRSAP